MVYSWLCLSIDQVFDIAFSLSISRQARNRPIKRTLVGRSRGLRAEVLSGTSIVDEECATVSSIRVMERLPTRWIETVVVDGE